MLKFKKTALALVTILAFLFQAGTSFAQPKDIEGHWAEEEILKWLDKGWAVCDENGNFYPDTKITRGEFIALTNKAFGFVRSTNVNFSDLPKDHRYAAEVAKAVAAGYISGFGDETVRPDEYITRLEMAAILAKIAELPLAEDESILKELTDYENIPNWGRPFVAAVVNAGILSDYTDGSFGPYEPVTKAEAINILDNTKNIFGYFSDKFTTPGFLANNPTVVDNGMLNRIMVYYVFGEDFYEGTVIFHLPQGITAVENRDIVTISDPGGRVESFKLGPGHIANGGKEVHLTGITAEKEGLIILLLKEQDLSEPGYYYFSVTADADGPGEKFPVEHDFFGASELFSRIPVEYEGVLEISPQSAKGGSKQTFTLSYTLGDDFNEGWVEFYLPEEMTATAGKDKLILNGTEKVLTSDDISDAGQRVFVKGISAHKGDKVVLSIFDKIIPEGGPYFFGARADADGEGTAKPATMGAGGEFKTFLAYSEEDEDKDRRVVESFINAMEERDLEAIMDLLAENVIYVDNYMDGYFDLYESKEDIEVKLESMLSENEGILKNDKDTLINLAENIWQINGKASDYSDRLVAQLNPDSGFEGFGYTARFFVADNKICFLEFLWHREDEILYDKLNEGSIGAFMFEKDNGEAVIRGCVPEMPAEKAGILPGDIIVAVNGIKLEDMDYGFEEFRLRVVGKVGTKVTLTIKRNGEVFDVEIEREAL